MMAWPTIPIVVSLRCNEGKDIMDRHKLAVILSALCITATTTTLASAQEATFSEGERLGLAACLSKCPYSDKACNNRCISLSQTKGRVWGDDVRACIRGCRVGQGNRVKDFTLR